VRRFAAAVVLSAVLGIVVAGCGGSSPEEEWAGSVCSDVADWKSEIQQNSDNITSQLQSPKAGTLAAIDAEIQKAVDATQQLATDLRSTNPPDTDAGKQATQQLTALATQLDTTVRTAKQSVQSVPKDAGLSEKAQKLAPLVPAVSSLAVSASSTLAAIQARSDELKKGFDQADSCKQFRNSN
jgi:hypothetical protein